MFTKVELVWIDPKLHSDVSHRQVAVTVGAKVRLLMGLWRLQTSHCVDSPEWGMPSYLILQEVQPSCTWTGRVCGGGGGGGVGWGDVGGGGGDVGGGGGGEGCVEGVHVWRGWRWWGWGGGEGVEGVGWGGVGWRWSEVEVHVWRGRRWRGVCGGGGVGWGEVRWRCMYGGAEVVVVVGCLCVCVCVWLGGHWSFPVDWTGTILCFHIRK